MSGLKIKGRQRQRQPKPYERRNYLMSRVRSWFTPSSWWGGTTSSGSVEGESVGEQSQGNVTESLANAVKYGPFATGNGQPSGALPLRMDDTVPLLQSGGVQHSRSDYEEQASGGISVSTSGATRQLFRSDSDSSNGWSGIPNAEQGGSESDSRTGMEQRQARMELRHASERVTEGGVGESSSGMEPELTMRDSEESWVAEESEEEEMEQTENRSRQQRNPASGVWINPSIRRRPPPKTSSPETADTRPSYSQLSRDFLLAQGQPRTTVSLRTSSTSPQITSQLSTLEYAVERLSRTSKQRMPASSIFSNRTTANFSRRLHPVTTSTPQLSPVHEEVEHTDGVSLSQAVPPPSYPPPLRPHTSQSHTPAPSFSITPFTTPSQLYTDISLGRSPFQTSFQSPFYSGRTSFGGVASTQRMRAKRPRTESSPPTFVPVRHAVKARPAGGRQQSVASQTAKKILETLETLSSPLMDARRLPYRRGPPEIHQPAKRRRADLSSSVLSPPPVDPLLTPSHTSLSTPHAPVFVPNEKTFLLRHREGTVATAGISTTKKQSETTQSTHSPSKMADATPKASIPFQIGKSKSPHSTLSTSPPTQSQPFSLQSSTSQSSVLSGLRFTAPLVSRPLGEGLMVKQGSPLERRGDRDMMVSSAASTVSFKPVFHSVSPQSSSGGGGKLRVSLRGSHHYSSRRESDSEDYVNPMELPPSVPLTLGKGAALPKFSFAAELFQPKVSQATPPTALAVTIATSSTPLSGGPASFSFSTPKALGSQANTSTTKQTSAFSFRTPRNCTTSALTPTPTPLPSISPSLSYTRPLALLPTRKPKVKSPPDVIQPPLPLKKMSVVEALKRPEFQPLGVGREKKIAKPVPKAEVIDLTEDDDSSGGSGNKAPPPLKPLPQFAPPTGSWSCDTCFISNKPSESKCIACGAPKPCSKQAKPTTEIKLGSAGGFTLGSGLKVQTSFGGLQNTRGLTLLASASESKTHKMSGGEPPQIKTSVAKDTKSVSASAPLKPLSQFAPPAGSWTCDVCMIPNKPEAVTCAACSTPKPGNKRGDGASKQDAPKLLLSTSGGLKLSFPGGMKLGGISGSQMLEDTKKMEMKSDQQSVLKPLPQFAPPSGSWTCDTCMINNKPEDSKCAACSTPKPGATGSGTKTGGGVDSGTKSGGLRLGPSGGFQLGLSGGFKLGSGITLGAGMGEIKSSAPFSTGGIKLGSLPVSTEQRSEGAKNDSGTGGTALKFGSGGIKLGTAPSFGEKKASADAQVSDSRQSAGLGEGRLMFDAQKPTTDEGSQTNTITNPSIKFGTSSSSIAAFSTAVSTSSSVVPSSLSQPSAPISFKIGQLSSHAKQNPPQTSSSTNPLAGIKFGAPLAQATSNTPPISIPQIKFGTAPSSITPQFQVATSSISVAPQFQFSSVSSGPQLQFTSPLTSFGENPTKTHNQTAAAIKFSGADSRPPHQGEESSDQKPTFVFSATKDSKTALDQSPFPIAGSASTLGGGFGARSDQALSSGIQMKFGAQSQALSALILGSGGVLGGVGSHAAAQQQIGGQQQHLSGLAQSSVATSQLPVFGMPQQVAQPSIFGTQQTSSSAVGFKFHASGAQTQTQTQGTSSLTLGNQSSTPKFNFGSSGLNFAFGQGKNQSGNNSGLQATGNLGSSQGLGTNTVGGAPQLQFGQGGQTMFSAGGSNQLLSASNTVQPGTGFQFNANIPMNLNVASADGNVSAPLFTAGSNNTVSNRVIKKGRRRKV